MKILIEIAQQTNVHFFKNIIGGLRSHGHEVLVLGRERESTVELMAEYGIGGEAISSCKPGKLNLLRELLLRDFRIWREGRRFRPDLVFTRSVAGVHAARLLGVPVILDNDNGRSGGLVHKIMVPLATRVYTPDCQGEDYGSRHFKYPGYKELAYLHPDNFTPDPAVRRDLGVGEGERYYILRFTSLQACHDSGRKGMSRELKERLIRLLSRRGRVFISSEREFPEEWEKYRLSLSPGRIHSALYFADIYAGDSGTMAAEAAVLGTPSIFMLTFAGTLYYLKELEARYGLLFHLSGDQEDRCLEIVRGWLEKPGLKEEWSAKRETMLKDKIDVADFYVRLIDGWDHHKCDL